MIVTVRSAYKKEGRLGVPYQRRGDRLTSAKEPVKLEKPRRILCQGKEVIKALSREETMCYLSVEKGGRRTVDKKTESRMKRIHSNISGDRSQIRKARWDNSKFSVAEDGRSTLPRCKVERWKAIISMEKEKERNKRIDGNRSKDRTDVPENICMLIIRYGPKGGGAATPRWEKKKGGRIVRLKSNQGNWKTLFLRRKGNPAAHQARREGGVCLRE